MELTDAMPLGETRGSIRAVSKFLAAMYTPASIGIVYERDKKECKGRKECGRHGDLGCSKEMQPIL